MNFSRHLLIFAMLLATQAAWAAPARVGNAFFEAQSASVRHISCAECYELESDFNELVTSITCPAPGNPAQNTPQLTTQYAPRPESDFTTGILFAKTLSSNGQPLFAYFHHDHLQTPLQATDKAGNIVWAASYNAFGRASIITPAATASAPTVAIPLRLPGQYEDQETGFHYNYRRYYDPDTGRYWTQDPIGLEGGINQYRYAQADPINLTDPTGELAFVPVVVAGAVCMASCMATTAAEDLITGECTTIGTNAKNCAIGCALGGVGAVAMKAGKWAKRAYDNLPCAINSFPADTLVHVKPAQADATEAQSAQAILKPISQLQPGDEVLAFSEWKERGITPVGMKATDQRLSYEKVTDVFSSIREQTIVHISLDNGEQLSVTAGHPFFTNEGWRDAVMLKKGGKLLLKGSEEDVAGQRFATITDIRQEVKTIPVFNLEVANAHTFFVGDVGVLVHNGGGCRKQVSSWFPSMKRAKDASKGKGGDGIPHGPDKFGKDGHFHDGDHDKPWKPNIHYRWGGKK